MGKQPDSESKRQKENKPPFSNFLLIWTFIVVNLFIVAVLTAFIVTGSEPVTLIVSVFAFFGFECGIMGWIKTSSKKKEDDKDDGNDPSV
ncbi:MAG: hypothetical protein FWF15_11450 [Oscillospiraceae bacterium]|nr:hypothetical protein [Oscillospiraceae bacterium]